MTTSRSLSRCSIVASAAIFGAALLLAQIANAQRPSVAEMQAQIDALTYPYDEPAAQVRTALDILPTFQEAVVRSFRATGEAPANRSTAGLTAAVTDTSTSFITAVAIVNGSVVFTFNQADTHPAIAGKFLQFTPYESPDGTVVWRCGNDPIAAGVNLLGWNSGNSANFVASTIPATAHPNPCVLQSFADSGEVIRAQVATALEILPAAQQGVVDHYRQTGAAPVDRVEAGLTSPKTDTSTNYISEVEIFNGTIVIKFGHDAHIHIQGKTLTFTPYETADLTVVWRCGNDPYPSGTSLLGTSGGGSVAVYQAPTVPGYLHPRPCITRAYAALDDVIMAQVLEPFDVVETFKDAIEAAGAAAGSPSEPIPPADRNGAGLTPDMTDTFGRYFSSVGIANGTITVTYNTAETNAAIQGDTITWVPYETPDGTIVWRCGNQPQPAGAQLMGSASAIRVAVYFAPTMPNRYLPTDCRP